MKKLKSILLNKYPPSKPCSCNECVRYCSRPGWWTVEECNRLIYKGMEGRLMLEVSPGLSFGVLSLAFKGNEGYYALPECASNGCTFLNAQKFELHGTGLQPLECRFCHHERKGLGLKCHLDIEKDWQSCSGQMLVSKWLEIMCLPCFLHTKK